MRWASLYVVPSDLLLENRPKDPWHAQAFPVDPSQTLLIVHWDNPNFEAEFESLDGVRFLGFPWEAVPADVIPLLASLPSDGPTDSAAAASSAAELPVTDNPTNPAPDSLARTAKNISWLNGLLR